MEFSLTKGHVGFHEIPKDGNCKLSFAQMYQHLSPSVKSMSRFQLAN